MNGRREAIEKVPNAWRSESQSNKNNEQKNKIEEKFLKAQQKHINAAKKHMQKYESSSDEEETQEGDAVLSDVLKNYTGSSSDLAKTQEFLENILQSGSAICLICIASVKRADEIWSCINCYTFFHLQCAQRWANGSMVQKQVSNDEEQGYYNNAGEYIPKKTKLLLWDCPKCRYNYSPDKIPRHYSCFCGNEINPPYHPWLIPHSCSGSCGKPLKPDCGHKCLLLCHPGPCPPCPQMITKSCKCGLSAPKTVRCSNKIWTCLKKCDLNLSCLVHKCNKTCHSINECPPCKERSVQKCCCGLKSKEISCTQVKWKCDKICNKVFSCGLHKCLKLCHSDECGECPLGLPRTCPCGKKKSIAPCSEQTESCGGTCQKMLECNMHRCTERCHKGKCSECIDIVEKKCRCGNHSKELRCSKQFTCETKCKTIRECKKHPCNRKCCDGQCPPCDKICAKSLSCNKHKCQSLCHNGPCYPCNEKGTVKCRCGNTVMTVSCGHERKTKIPKCAHPCKIPSSCHHSNPHRCHMNECPPCIQICDLKNTTTKCQHPCSVKCHDSVKVSIVDKNFKPSVPWEVQPEQFVFKKLPHPPCEFKVSVTCIGGHETTLWSCSNSKPMSCGRVCGRKLVCGNHICELQCHSLTNLKSDMAEQNCLNCHKECEVPRNNGCIHPCKMNCHPPPCQPCNVNIKSNCHCGIAQVFYKCGQFYREINTEEETSILAQEKEKILSCGGRCIKNYECGHRCQSLCHSGFCPNSEQCRKKVKLYCPCKNVKSDVPCEKIRLENITIKCDESCKKKIQDQLETQKQKELIAKQIEDEKNRIELEEFEKKFGKKKSRERKAVVVEEKEDNKYLFYAGTAGFAIVVIAVLIYYAVVSA